MTARLVVDNLKSSGDAVKGAGGKSISGWSSSTSGVGGSYALYGSGGGTLKVANGKSGISDSYVSLNGKNASGKLVEAHSSSGVGGSYALYGSGGGTLKVASGNGNYETLLDAYDMQPIDDKVQYLDSYAIIDNGKISYKNVSSGGSGTTYVDTSKVRTVAKTIREKKGEIDKELNKIIPAINELNTKYVNINKETVTDQISKVFNDLDTRLDNLISILDTNVAGGFEELGESIQYAFNSEFKSQFEQLIGSAGLETAVIGGSMQNYNQALDYSSDGVMGSYIEISNGNISYANDDAFKNGYFATSKNGNAISDSVMSYINDNAFANGYQGKAASSGGTGYISNNMMEYVNDNAFANGYSYDLNGVSGKSVTSYITSGGSGINIAEAKGNVNKGTAVKDSVFKTSYIENSDSISNLNKSGGSGLNLKYAKDKVDKNADAMFGHETLTSYIENSDSTSYLNKSGGSKLKYADASVEKGTSNKNAMYGSASKAFSYISK